MIKLNKRNITVTYAKLRTDNIYDETYKKFHINSCAWCVYRRSCIFIGTDNKSARKCFRFVLVTPDNNIQMDKVNLYINLKYQDKLLGYIIRGSYR